MARIIAPFGVKGWVKLQTFTEVPDSLDAYASWLIKGSQGWEEFELEDFAVNAKGVIAKLRGCNDRTQAELLKKCEIGIPREALDDPDVDEHYWIDLIGSTVLNIQGEHLGTIETLMETGANDVLVVRDGQGDALRETLIPFIDGVVISVDCEAKQITVDWQRDAE